MTNYAFFNRRKSITSPKQRNEKGSKHKSRSQSAKRLKKACLLLNQFGVDAVHQLSHDQYNNRTLNLSTSLEEPSAIPLAGKHFVSKQDIKQIHEQVRILRDGIN